MDEEYSIKERLSRLSLFCSMGCAALMLLCGGIMSGYLTIYGGYSWEAPIFIRVCEWVASIGGACIGGMFILLSAIFTYFD